MEAGRPWGREGLGVILAPSEGGTPWDERSESAGATGGPKHAESAGKEWCKTLRQNPEREELAATFCSRLDFLFQ